MDLHKIKSPTLILDEQKCRDNINYMLNKAKNHNLELRPHFKTHQSKVIGNWFREAGIHKITVSSIKMAKYFAEDKWNDITIAFPVNIREIEDINNLADKIKVNLTIENTESIDFLTENLQNKVGYFIKIDTGYKRTGVSFDIFLTIDKIIKASENSPHLNFKGFISHSGHTYNANSKEEILAIHNDSLKKLSSLKNQYIDKYPNLIISTGDTPSNSLAKNFENITELRPGNFVFYDLMQLNLGSCSFNNIAVVMACPVVAKHSDRNEVIIYGGGVHFSKESIMVQDQKIYGQLVNLSENGWENIIENAYLIKLSQEHGTLKVSNEIFDTIKIGDIVGIIPIHSCMTANLMREYFTIENKKIDHL